MINFEFSHIQAQIYTNTPTNIFLLQTACKQQQKLESHHQLNKSYQRFIQLNNVYVSINQWSRAVHGGGGKCETNLLYVREAN